MLELFIPVDAAEHR